MHLGRVEGEERKMIKISYLKFSENFNKSLLKKIKCGATEERGYASIHVYLNPQSAYMNIYAQKDKTP